MLSISFHFRLCIKVLLRFVGGRGVQRICNSLLFIPSPLRERATELGFLAQKSFSEVGEGVVFWPYHPHPDFLNSRSAFAFARARHGSLVKSALSLNEGEGIRGGASAYHPQPHAGRVYLHKIQSLMFHVKLWAAIPRISKNCAGLPEYPQYNPLPLRIELN